MPKRLLEDSEEHQKKHKKSKLNKKDKKEKVKKEKKEKDKKDKKDKELKSKSKSETKPSNPASDAEITNPLEEASCNNGDEAVNTSEMIKKLSPNDFSLSDFENIEHSVGVIQTQLQRLIEIAPTQEKLNQYMQRVIDIQSNTFDSFGKDLSGKILILSRSNKLQLGTALKTLYVDGKLKIFDQIINFDNDTQIEGSLNTSLIMKKLSENKINVQNRGKYHDLPPLPPIADPSLEARVFVHKSYTNGNLDLSNIDKIQTNNERLEFIGDAVLELIATDIVCERYPDLSEGELSRIRIAIVRNETLEKFARSYGFHQKAELIYKGREGSEGFEKSVNIIESDNKKYTKLIADLMEAYIGALYIDKGGVDGYNTIKQWLTELYEDFLDKYDMKLGLGKYSNQPKITNKKHHSFEDDGSKPVPLNPYSSSFKEVKSNVTNCDISQRLALNSKTELYALVGCAIRYPRYEKLEPLPAKFIKDVPKGCTFNVVGCYLDDEVIGTGEGTSYKDASFRAAMAALENRKAVEKYHMLRLMIPKDQTSVKQTVPENKKEKKETPVVDEVQKPIATKELPKIDLPHKLESFNDDFDNRARSSLQNILRQKKIMPEFVTTNVQSEHDSKKPIFKTTLKIKGKTICESLDMTKKNGSNRVCDWVLKMMKDYGEDNVLELFN